MTSPSPDDRRRLRVIIAHDYLIQMGGAERVVASLHRTFPRAPLYVSATDSRRLLDELRAAEIHNTWMQRIPGINRHFRKLYPLYPLAFKSFGVLDADVAIVSSSGFSKWLRFSPRTKVFCYCHTPPRFFWQPEEYLQNEVQSPWLKRAVQLTLPWFRHSDRKSAQRMNYFIANSEGVRQRIHDCYQASSVVIHPPVQMERFRLGPVPHAENRYYLIVARLVGHKRIDRSVRAFSQSKRRLIIIGEGPDLERLKGLAAPNVVFKGRLSDRQVQEHLENCYALVQSGSEDFGITPLEAQACGKPVFAFAHGGALESVVDGRTGLFFAEDAPEAMNAMLDQFEKIAWSPEEIRRNASQYDESKFIAKLTDYIQSKLEESAAGDREEKVPRPSSEIASVSP